MTTTAPRNPWIHVVNDAHPKLTTKSGMANGTTTSTAHIRRPGRSVRSTHHTVKVPMMAHRAVTTTVSRIVFHRRVPVSGRKMRWRIVDAPALPASINRKTRGASRTMATPVLMANRTFRCRVRRSGTDPGGGRSRTGSVNTVLSGSRCEVSAPRRAHRHPTGQSSPACFSSPMAVEPSPSLAGVMAFGSSWSKGVSG